MNSPSSPLQWPSLPEQPFPEREQEPNLISSEKRNGHQAIEAQSWLGSLLFIAAPAFSWTFTFRESELTEHYCFISLLQCKAKPTAGSPWLLWHQNCQHLPLHLAVTVLEFCLVLCHDAHLTWRLDRYHWREWNKEDHTSMGQYQFWWHDGNELMHGSSTTYNHAGLRITLNLLRLTLNILRLTLKLLTLKLTLKLFT